MQDLLTSVLPLLIPIIALLIGLVGATGTLIVKPLVQALTRLTETQESLRSATASGQQIALLEQRLESMEDALRPLLEEREFHRQLDAGVSLGATSLQRP